ncbi:uncharacterized protein BHQ10_005780 [Talaromyces amestolkiae]|uniref:Xylanolytic transcriptional activator regulatory domain-containing protein n=1 Tax=Talaromyces amestolkiae TaxID=1196081 RepID=A0A364L1T1_TALAM|nr:uncharacterized protein BHQ10_005780 [Talaromyces amestolkiae]RAO69768.1 hypothetical protein BHQ10_005780 [Talaromyces amestolkiae]
MSRPETSLNPDLLQRNVKFLQNLTVVPSQSGTSNFPLSSHSMGGLYELLLADKPSFEEALQDCEESKARVREYIDTYIKSFHLRWPVLHAPTLDNEIGTMPLSLAAAACLIGAWFQNSADWTERFYSLRMHEVLLERLLHSLIEPELTSGEKAWPIELFQTVLLTLVFSLYRTDKRALSRAKLLRSTFITLLRDLGVLDGEKFTAHLKTHYTGTYTPYTLAMREKLKRLLVLTFQFDAFFALIYRQPPLLHLQEIGVGLTSTFALWNAYGLDVFALRELEEPHERSKVRISEMIGRSDSVTSSGILVEDVLLSLCSVLQSIWAFLQALPSSQKENPSHTFQKALLVQTLDDWRHELDKISKLADSGNLPGSPARYLLLAYRGENDSMTASLERINSLVQDGMILYYHLRLTQYVFDIAGPGKGVVSHSNLWETSKHKKEALVCALQMLKVVESKASFNPLIRHVLAIGVDITKASLSRQKCHFNGQHAVRNDTQHWSNIGDPFWVDGTPVCVCKLAFWIGRFEKAIQDQDIMVE